MFNTSKKQVYSFREDDWFLSNLKRNKSNLKALKAALINILQSEMNQMCNVKGVTGSDKPTELTLDPAGVFSQEKLWEMQ